MPAMAAAGGNMFSGCPIPVNPTSGMLSYKFPMTLVVMSKNHCNLFKKFSVTAQEFIYRWPYFTHTMK